MTTAVDIQQPAQPQQNATLQPNDHAPATSPTIAGTVTTITWASEETGFGIARLKADEAYLRYPCVNKGGICTLVGPIAKITPGEHLQVWGKMKEHPKYGPQVEVESFRLMEPKGYWELIHYLSKNVKGIEKVLAKAIVDKFGENTLAVIDHTPERLLEVHNVGDKRLKEIIAIWQEQREFRTLLMFATNIGIGGAALQKIYKKYKGRAVEVIRQDPYRLSRDIWGIGFKKADEIAKHLGVPELSPLRLTAAIEHILTEKSQQVGDCFQYAVELVQATIEFLNEPNTITNELIRRTLLDAVKNKKLVADGDKIYLPALYDAEQYVATVMGKIARDPMPLTLQGKKLDQAVSAAIQAFKFEPAPTQHEGVVKCLSSKISVLTGGPGTGKTSITQAIVHGFEKAGIQVTLMAPTGRAAKRMKEVIGRESSTIHRILFTKEKSLRESDDGGVPEHVRIGGVIILDEVSMVDVQLLKWLLKFVKLDAILVFVGDKDQLPSVGAGAVLRDLIESGVIAVTHLTQVFRQAAGSNISLAAADVNAGKMPNLNYFGRNHPVVQSDIYTVVKEDAEEQAQVALWCATEMPRQFGFDPIKDCQVLCPMRKGAAGVENMNGLLQKALNPSPSKFVERGAGIRWGIGDKVMQTSNDYLVGAMNGDLGSIVSMDVDGGKLAYLEVDFEGHVCKYTCGEEWEKLSLAYATTIHKSQGSEHKMVVLLMHTSHYMMLQRNLLYTAMTRGKKLVVQVVHPDALRHAVNNNKIARRNTMLAERLVQQVRAA
jgi:exodeoxyribonuclease V alpha subunit